MTITIIGRGISHEEWETGSWHHAIVEAAALAARECRCVQSARLSYESYVQLVGDMEDRASFDDMGNVQIMTCTGRVSVMPGDDVPNDTLFAEVA